MISPDSRVGCVPYLNARPLLEGLPFSVRKLAPAQLHGVFKSGELDVALLSSIDVISKDQADVVDGISISSKGDVHSVVLAYRGALNELTKVTLDPASHTSNALLRIVLGEFYGIYPEYVQSTVSESLSMPMLMIGDRAISFRKKTTDPSVRYLDLGGEWYRKTGLPFVFALWELNKEFTKKKLLSELIRKAKREGISAIPKIAAHEEESAFAESYLRHHIRYDFGDEEKRGLQAFGEYLLQLKISNNIVKSISYY